MSCMPQLDSLVLSTHVFDGLMKEAEHGAVSDITELLSRKAVTSDPLCIYLPGTLLIGGGGGPGGPGG